jgi:hypothetical protein
MAKIKISGDEILDVISKDSGIIVQFNSDGDGTVTIFDSKTGEFLYLITKEITDEWRKISNGVD